MVNPSHPYNDHVTISHVHDSIRVINLTTCAVSYPDVKEHYHVPDLNISIYAEARYGVVTAIDSSEHGDVATLMMLKSYHVQGANGKVIEKQIYHIPIAVRSELGGLAADA